MYRVALDVHLQIPHQVDVSVENITLDIYRALGEKGKYLHFDDRLTWVLQWIWVSHFVFSIKGHQRKHTSS